jgi:antitoxin HigA-1
MSPQFWLNLQSAYELRLAERQAGHQINRLPTRPAA